MDTNFSYDEIGVEYPKVMTIYGESLIKILGMQTVPKDFKKYTLPYYDTHLNKEIQPLIRLTYSDGTTSV